jgi:hypothetical protein
MIAINVGMAGTLSGVHGCKEPNPSLALELIPSTQRTRMGTVHTGSSR